MTVKKSKSAKRAFLGRFLTFWVSLIRRIRILQKIWLLDNVYPKYGPSMFENDQKSEEMDQKSSHSLIFLCFWVIRLWRTRISTWSWWFYDPLPRYGSLKMQNRPKLTVNGAKIKVWFFHFLGNLTMGNSNLKTFLMILVSIFEKMDIKCFNFIDFWINRLLKNTKLC
jgi:hypothetical protein